MKYDRTADSRTKSLENFNEVKELFYVGTKNDIVALEFVYLIKYAGVGRSLYFYTIFSL